MLSLSCSVGALSSSLSPGAFPVATVSFLPVSPLLWFVHLALNLSLCQFFSLILTLGSSCLHPFVSLPQLEIPSFFLTTLFSVCLPPPPQVSYYVDQANLHSWWASCSCLLNVWLPGRSRTPTLTVCLSLSLLCLFRSLHALAPVFPVQGLHGGHCLSPLLFAWPVSYTVDALKDSANLGGPPQAKEIRRGKGTPDDSWDKGSGGRQCATYQ